MTAQTPPAGPATTDRALLVDVRRWALYNGWTYSHAGWINARHDAPATLAVSWDANDLEIRRKPAGRTWWPGQSLIYRVASPREAVDVLAALGILAPQLSSAYRTAHAEREQSDRDAAQAYADRARLWQLADAVRRAADEYEGHQAELPQDVVCCPGCDIASSLSAALDAAGADRPAVDVDGLLANVRLSLASATTDDERAEAIEMLLEDWYAAWPDSAVTSPHEPLAAELVRLLAPWAAKVQQLQGPLAGYALVTLPEQTGRAGEVLPPLPDTAYPPNATPLDPACPGDPHCRAGHRCDHHRAAAAADDVPPNAGSAS